MQRHEYESKSDEALGWELRRIRRQLRLTRVEMAKALGYTGSQRRILYDAIARLETGARRVPYDRMLLALCYRQGANPGGVVPTPPVGRDLVD